LPGFGQLTEPQQVDDLLEADPAGQLVDIVAAIVQLAVLAVHEAQVGVGRHYFFQTANRFLSFVR
jgi:hypothetical protein